MQDRVVSSDMRHTVASLGLRIEPSLPATVRARELENLSTRTHTCNSALSRPGVICIVAHQNILVPRRSLLVPFLIFGVAAATDAVRAPAIPLVCIAVSASHVLRIHGLEGFESDSGPRWAML